MNVAEDKMVVLWPVVAIHFGLVGVDVVGEYDLSPLAFKSEAHQPYAREELRGGEAVL